ncbi:MAG: hypothetical protein U9Q69_01910 [Nanoarchaeota archaeon]|nr:hypothetical protein [Nanoarchaeota archaeon]
MSFNFIIVPKLQKVFRKIAKKDNVLALAIDKKIKQIIAYNYVSIDNFKNLRGNMGHLKGVHIGSFVLLFKVKGDTIIFESFTHHDKAYRR